MEEPTPPVSTVPGTVQDLKRSRILLGCGALIALLLVAIAALLFLLWWSQRPIRPVVLTQKEKAVVEEKLQQLGATVTPKPATPATPTPTAHESTEPLSPPPPTPPATRTPLPSVRERRGDLDLDPPYTPGSRILRLTEREINGLLNQNTELGNRVRIEFGRDAINAYLAVPIPEDFPVAPGRMFRARGRFRVAIEPGGKPLAVLEDLTIFGLSLPKAWLGGIKGENLLGEAIGENSRGPFLRGIRSLRIEPGTLVLELEE